MQICNTIKRRMVKSAGLPDRDDVSAMEEPHYRIVDVTSLFCDLVFSVRKDDPPKPCSLTFLAKILCRETDRLYRLFTGTHLIRG